MRVLIACEFSGRVRDAFLARGHDAWSCDLLPTDSPGPHIQDDVLKHLSEQWDMIIAFPPCTYLCASGHNARGNEPGRAEGRAAALQFVKTLWSAPTRRICIENPSGLQSIWLRPSQHIEPWMFGDPYAKRTYLWLRDLPALFATRIMAERREYVRSLPQTKDRPKKRSLTFCGVAEAMAEQWGEWSK